MTILRLKTSPALATALLLWHVGMVSGVETSLHTCALTLCPQARSSAMQYLVSGCEGSFSDFVAATTLPQRYEESSC
jgi:hypothetical protein